MIYQNVLRRKWAGRILFCVLLLAVLWMPAARSQAASVKSMNKKADKLYEKKLTSLRKTSYVSCKWADLTGDGVHEGIFVYQLRSGGMGDKIDIYTYKKGKISRILTEEKYGPSQIIAYRKSGSVLIYCAGHGGETYHYYKLKNGTYKGLGSQSRQAIAGGSIANGPWVYSTAKGAATTKAKFDKAVKGVKKGSRTILKIADWKSYY